MLALQRASALRRMRSRSRRPRQHPIPRRLWGMKKKKKKKKGTVIQKRTKMMKTTKMRAED
jgi:hypothetical protein